MAYTVRRVTADEWQRYRELRLQALLDSPTNFGQTHENALAMSDQLWRDRVQTVATSDEQAFYVAVDEAEPDSPLLGMWGVVPHLSRPGVWIIIGVFVRPETRGTDVARRLSQACVDFARTTDAKELILDVRDDNGRARRFYEREGFVETGVKEPHNIDPTHDLIEMRYESFR